MGLGVGAGLGSGLGLPLGREDTRWVDDGIRGRGQRGGLKAGRRCVAAGAGEGRGVYGHLGVPSDGLLTGRKPFVGTSRASSVPGPNPSTNHT